jgi:uncharacterized membrane protein YdfJ with MMPL/SSD domain
MAYIPVILVATVFGLSIDYEVFLISRIHEEWRRTGDHAVAINQRLGNSGRVISAAATVMIVVFPDLRARAFGSHRMSPVIPWRARSRQSPLQWPWSCCR